MPVPGAPNGNGEHAPPAAVPPSGSTQVLDATLQGALNTVLSGVLARLETPGLSDPTAVTDALKQSMALGRAYAERGYSSASLIQTYVRLRQRVMRVLPPQVRGDEPWVLEWYQRLQRAVDDFLIVGLEAFERERIGEWERRAYLDGLTGVYNRAYFERRFPQEVRRAARHRRPLTLMIADVDNLKAMNDRLGHAAGDRLLQLSGRALQSVLRGDDVVARYGGDEFVVLLPDTPLAGAQVSAERALRAVREQVAAQGLDGDGAGFSIGLATFPAHGAEPAALLAAADLALYRAKRSGSGLALANDD